MKFKRNIFTSLLIKHWIVFLLIIFMSLPAGACTIPIEVLGSHFVEELSPEQALVIVDSLPTCDGYVSHLYMKLQGAVVEGLRIDEIAIEARDVILIRLPSGKKSYAQKKSQPFCLKQDCLKKM